MTPSSMHAAVAASAEPLSERASKLRAWFETRLALWLALPVGAALALAFAPFDVWPLAMVCPVYIYLAWTLCPAKRAAKFGFLFTSGTYLSGTYWLYHSIHEIGHAPIPLTIFVMLALVAIMGSYMAGLSYAVARLRTTYGIERTSSLLLYMVLLLPAAWVLLEWFRGWFLSGFPWLALGYTQIDTPLSGFAPVGGVYLVSWTVALIAGALALALLRSTREWLAAAGVFAVVFVSGFGLKRVEWTQPTDQRISVAIVQGAVPQEMKWSEAQRQATIDLYRTLTAPHFGTDLIVWPEAALPALVHEVADLLRDQWQQARAQGSDLLIGQLRYDADTKNYQNPMLALSDEAQWYTKRRLVPFSEYFPELPDWITSWLRQMDLPYSGFEAGSQDQRALSVAGVKVGASICYEDAYASDQLRVLREATLLANVTNDAWFGDSTAAPQHLQISRMRALEAGRPLVRAANDGISAIIDWQGELVSTFPRFKPGVLTGDVVPREGLTPYARVGNWLVVILCALLALGGLAIATRTRRRSV